MNRVLAAFVLTGACAAAASGEAPPGHRLPDGPQRPLRDRPIDIQHLQATLRVDMARETVAGTADITFVPLRGSLTEVTLDAAPGLDVASVTLDGSAPLALDRQRSAVRVTLPAALGSPAARTLRVTYATRPRSGLYFFPGRARARAAGLELRRRRHPLRLAAPVQRHRRPVHPRPADHRAAPAGGGRQRNAARKPSKTPTRTRTFHWTQDEPIPNYLIALQVGDFARVPLADARLPTRTVPLAVWTMPGTEKNAALRLWRHAAHGGVLLPQVRLRVSRGRATTRSRCATSPARWRPPARWASPSPSCAAAATRWTRGRRSARPTRRGRARTPSPTSWPITGSATSSPAARWRRCG